MKASGLSLISMYLDNFNLGYNKNKLYNFLDYWSRDMLNLNFPEKGQGLFCVWFSKKNGSDYIFY